MFKSSSAYFFLAGIYIGGYTNLFSKIIISGLVLYIVHPENFDPRRFSPLYLQIYNSAYPYLSKVYSFSNLQIEAPRVEVMPSPSFQKLPPISIKK